MAQIIVLTLILAMPHIYSPKLVKAWEVGVYNIKATETAIGGEQAVEKINSAVDNCLNKPGNKGLHDFKVVVNNKNLCVLEIETTIGGPVKDEQGKERTDGIATKSAYVWISADKENDTVNIRVQDDAPGSTANQ